MQGYNRVIPKQKPGWSNLADKDKIYCPPKHGTVVFFTAQAAVRLTTVQPLPSISHRALALARIALCLHVVDYVGVMRYFVS